MQQFSLSSEEGVVLMCLAESLLRIPDAETADKLIADKIGEKDWEAHLGQVGLAVRQRLRLGPDADGPFGGTWASRQVGRQVWPH